MLISKKKSIRITKRFKKDVKRIKRQKKDLQLMKGFISMLDRGDKVPSQYFAHRLKGNWIHQYECHLEPDWLVIWRDEDDIISLVRTGSHSELFQK